MANMKLTKEQKNAIKAEYENFTQSLKLDSETQSKLGQFFTPPELTIKMIEKFSIDDIKTKTVLDPCLGGGGLIAAMILAGADPKNCYGIELDPDVLVQARKRLNDLCDKSSLPHIPEQNLHQGDALINECYDFKSDYSFEKAKKAAADKASGLPPLFGHIKK